MIIRVVPANQNKAGFYDIGRVTDPLHRFGELEDPTARLHDRDLKSDRPGIVFANAPPASGWRGGIMHSGMGGEWRPRRHAARVFAAHIAQELQHAQQAGRLSRLMIVAGPSFLGLLRTALSQALERMVVAETSKNLLKSTDVSVRKHLPVEIFQMVP
jgi:protein required for attachment to host cells